MKRVLVLREKNEYKLIGFIKLKLKPDLIRDRFALETPLHWNNMAYHRLWTMSGVKYLKKTKPFCPPTFLGVKVTKVQGVPFINEIITSSLFFRSSGVIDHISPFFK